MSVESDTQRQSYEQLAGVLKNLSSWSASFANGVVESLESSGRDAAERLAALRGQYQGAIASAVAFREAAIATSDVVAEGVWREAANNMARTALQLADESLSAAERVAAFQTSVNEGLLRVGRVVGPAFDIYSIADAIIDGDGNAAGEAVLSIALGACVGAAVAAGGAMFGASAAAVMLAGGTGAVLASAAAPLIHPHTTRPFFDWLGSYLPEGLWRAFESTTFGPGAARLDPAGAVFTTLLLHRIDNSIQLADLGRLFDVAGSARDGRETVALLNSLGRVFTPAAPSLVDSATDQQLIAYAGRIAAITDRSPGGIRITASSPTVVDARNDFGAVLSLQFGLPVSIRLNDQSPTSAAALQLYALHRTDYERWLSDRSAIEQGKDPASLHFSDTYLQARADFVIAQGMARTEEAAALHGVRTVRDLRGPDNYFFDDRANRQQVQMLGTAPLAAASRVVFGTGRGDAELSGGAANDRIFGGDGNDTLLGLGGADWLEGNSGNDVLTAGAGDDTLLGGAGSDRLDGGEGRDRYVFAADQGSDRIVDSDGRGEIVVGGVRLTGEGARYAITPTNQASWVDAQGVRYRFNDTGSQRVTLTVTGGPLGGGDITIEDFDLARAAGEGFLGLQLSRPARSAIVAHAAGNPFAAGADAQPAPVAGTLAELGGTALRWFGNVAAWAGDRITISVRSGAAGLLQLVTGAQTLDLSQPVDIALAPGQTDRAFSIVSSQSFEGEQVLELVVTYHHGGDAVESNSLTLTLRDGGEQQGVIAGDYLALAVVNEGAALTRTREDGSTTTVVERGELMFVRDGQGNLVAGGGVLITDNTLYGSAGNDTIHAGEGNDLVQGGAGNDVIDGGAGDDMIAGGGGDDLIRGGDGDDYIASSMDIASGRQLLGPNDRWLDWGQPGGARVLHTGLAWGAYPALDGSDLVLWDGIGQGRTDAQHDVIDAGAGDDRVMGSWGDDRIKGGAGRDALDGLAGEDILEGEDGDDVLFGDGTIRPGFLNSVAGSFHGRDFLDGGAGDDAMVGGGAGDDLFGGSGDDLLFGDGSDAPGEAGFLDIAYHGADYLDGEDGSDYIEGGGGNDTLRGGAGDDVLRGDLQVEHAAALADATAAWGDDHLAGDEGADKLFGGGGSDVLLGGTGHDALWGDESSALLAGRFHGRDFLDGDEGDDLLVGGGADDILLGGAGNDTLRGDDELGVLALAFHGADLLDGGAGDDYLSGGGGDDVLIGGEGDDWLIGGEGADVLIGGAGADVYEFARGDGSDFIRNLDFLRSTADPARPQALDTLRFGPGVAAHEVVARRIDDDLLLQLRGTEDTVTVSGHFAAEEVRGEEVHDRRIDRIAFDDGESWDQSAIDAQVMRAAQNRAPAQLAPLPGLSARAGRAFVHQLPAGAFVDPDLGDEVSYSATLPDGSPLPSWLGFDPASRTFSGVPGELAVGTMSLALWATDRYGASTGALMTLNVAPPNRPPVAVQALADARVQQGAAFSYTVPAHAFSDPDSGDALALRVSLDDGSPLPEWLSFDAATRILTGQAPAGTGSALALQVHAADNDAAMASTALMLRIEPNHAPTLDKPLVNRSVGVGVRFSHTVPADAFSDLNADDALSYSATLADGNALPAWLQFDAATRTFSGMAPEATSLGVRVTASDPSGNAASDVFDIRSVLNTIVGSEEDDHLTGTSGADGLHGLGGQDVLIGGAGNDRLEGGAGMDRLDGGDGDDLLLGDAEDVLAGGAGNDTLVGGWSVNLGSGNDRWQISAATFYQVLRNAAPVAGQIKTLRLPDGVTPEALRVSRTGEDLMLRWEVAGILRELKLEGLYALADAPYRYAQSYRVEFEAAPGVVWSQFELLARISLMQAPDWNTVIDGTAGPDTLVDSQAYAVHGWEGDDHLSGNGINRLYGGAGADTLAHGDYLHGGPGDDILVDGGIMVGGGGLDRYIVGFDRAMQTIVANADGGDQVFIRGTVRPGELRVSHEPAGAVIVLTDLWGRQVRLEGQSAYGTGAPAPIAQLHFESTPDVTWTAAMLQQMGTTGDARQGNTLWGYADQPNVITGGAGRDELHGGNAADTLAGGAGADLLEGGLGEDTYVFGAYDGADHVVDRSGSGNLIALKPDITPATLQLLRTGQTGSGTMASNDSLVLWVPETGARLWVDEFFRSTPAGRSFTGIRFADGSAWNYDEIAARAGAALTGAVDALVGTEGDDMYSVDNARDTIAESPGGGIDSVYSSVSYTLPANVENLTLVGTLAADGTGNSGNNVLRGNDGPNVLRGTDRTWESSGGEDEYHGGKGDDTYIDWVGAGTNIWLFGAAREIAVFENPGEGRDTLVTNSFSLRLPSEVENLVVHRQNYSMGVFGESFSYLGNALDNIIDLSGSANTYEEPTIVIDGGAGNDTLIGSAAMRTANLIYIVDSVGDVVIEPLRRSDGFSSEVQSSVSYTLGANIDKLTLTGSRAIEGRGNEGANVLDGSNNAAANVLAGADGDDTYILGEGDSVVEREGGGSDTVVIGTQGLLGVAQLSLSQWQHVESLRLGQHAGDVDLVGDDGNNTLAGSLGSNHIQGLAGDDVLYNINKDRAAFHEIAGTAADRLEGGDGNDLIYSYGGFDLIEGGRGDDRIVLDRTRFATVDGGAGDDRIDASEGRFSVALAPGGGHDRIEAWSVRRSEEEWAWDRQVRSRIVLAAETDASSLRFERVGDALQVSIRGGADSVTVADYFEAGSSDIRSGVDAVILGDGTALMRDAVRAALSRQEPNDDVARSDFLVAGFAGSALVGGAGDDFLVGQSGADHLAGGEGSDTLLGGSGDDELVGGTGDDMLVGGRGADTYRFSAGWGRDVIDDAQRQAWGWDLNDDAAWDAVEFDASIRAADIHVQRAPEHPWDLLLTRVGSDDSLTLINFLAPDRDRGQVEVIRFADGTAWDRGAVQDILSTIRGTDGDDELAASTDMGSSLHGLAGNDVLTGGWYDDQLFGGDGDDVLSDPEGNNLLDGGRGADRMGGGYGNDTFVVDDPGDIVWEASFSGFDRVLSAISYVLPDHVEALTLTGAAATAATGNAMGNELIGNGADNVLDGAAGADLMAGGAGDDLYWVDHAADVVVEQASEGMDTVMASVSYVLPDHVENLTLTGTAPGRNGTGNALDNVLTGNSARNVLTGGAGNDSYVWGRGWGTDRVEENDATAGNRDVLQLGPDVAPDQLWFQRIGDDLALSVIGTTDTAVIANWYRGAQFQVEEIRTDDGQALLARQVHLLVEAMASFSPPPLGQTSFTPNYQAALGGAIVANWTGL
ncbi:putative Ig domain-containing protein [Ramlibacter rhizophilus]|nr:putative Ig domain-containing protein [Ramlibacter rhizophilus]